MIEYILAGAVVILIIVVVIGYKKYYKKICPVCLSPTCPGCPVYDLQSICDITSSRLVDSSSLLTGLTQSDISTSPELQETMYSFCDDAYISKNVCPTIFTTYEPLYTSLCVSTVSQPILSTGRKYKVSFRDTATGDVSSTVVSSPEAAASTVISGSTPSTAISITDDETGKPITPADLIKAADKGKSDRDNIRSKANSLCKIKKTLSPCMCESGSTKGTKTWDVSYQNKLGTICEQTPDVQAKIACQSTQPVSCSCK